jgi:hypothetical protein
VLGGMRWLNPRFTSGLEELLNPRVLEALDHVLSVAHHAHAVKFISGGLEVQARSFFALNILRKSTLQNRETSNK